jgi:hypothetical protein
MSCSRGARGEFLMTTRLISVSGLLVALTISGCASIRETAEQAAQAAQAAQSAADTARQRADEAQRVASGAQTTANQALSAAQAAQACCDATNQRLDRMFEQSQSK